MLQGRKNKPSGIEIIFGRHNKLRGDEFFVPEKGWFTDYKTDFQDNVSLHGDSCVIVYGT